MHRLTVTPYVSRYAVSCIFRRAPQSLNEVDYLSPCTYSLLSPDAL